MDTGPFSHYTRRTDNRLPPFREKTPEYQRFWQETHRARAACITIIKCFSMRGAALAKARAARRGEKENLDGEPAASGEGKENLDGEPAASGED